MNIKQLFADEDAVSPVIGVILMVAITVILAAVIGTFVLGLGDQVQNNAPSANFQFDYTDTPEVTITHNGGDNVERDNLEVSDGAGGTLTMEGAAGTTFSTGDTIVDTAGVSSGNTLRIIWNNPNGQSSQTIGSSQVP